MENINYNNADEVMGAIVKSGELPQYIYKYTSLDTATKILENNSIRFSKPPLFNDPFDCQLTINTDNTEEEVDNYVNQIALIKGLSNCQRGEYRTKLRKPNERFRITNDAIQQSINSLKVSCFSLTPDNLLMWAHYADKHYGVVLKFDILKDASFFMTPYPMNYVDNYPVFNYIRDDHFKGKGYLAKLLVETKSTDWAYENEIRIMKPDANIYNPVDYLDFSINKEAIVEILFGCQVDDKKKKGFVLLAKDKGWNNLIFQQSKKKQWAFGMDFMAYDID